VCDVARQCGPDLDDATAGERAASGPNLRGDE
jgi:hypothetical protein